MKRFSAIMSDERIKKEFMQYYYVEYFFPNDLCEDIKVCKRKEEAKDFARVFSLHSDFLVVCGSDEFLKEVVLGLILAHKDIPILFIPFDKTDFLSKPIGYKEPLTDYIKDALKNEPILYPVYEVKEYIENLASFESDFVLEKEMLLYHLSNGKFNKEFFYNMKQVLTSHNKPLEIYLDGALYKEECASFHLINQSEAKQLEIIITKKIDSLIMMKEIMEYLKKRRTLEELSFISLYKGREVLIKSNQPFSLLKVDGESAFKNSNILEIKPSTLVRIMTSKKK